MIVAATTQRIIGYVVLAVVLAGFAVWLIANLRASRAEAGSEIELAPNRKPYLTDDELETKQLNLALFSAAGLLAIIGVALPLYWLAEPGRQEGAVEMYHEVFVERGFELYETGAQCVACHGGAGSGGSASFIINDQNGQFVDEVPWTAPALNNVLYRYSEEGVRYILNYGRPGTPMAAWGAPGGGPLTTQQIDNLIDYLWTVQVSPKDLRKNLDDSIKTIDEGLYDRMLKVRESNDGLADPLKANRLSRADELALGEIIFNNQAIAAGSYSCARCHVAGAAYGQGWQPFARLQKGSFGPDLTGVENHATEQEHFDLVFNGMEPGIGYFSRKQGNPQMPAFGKNPNAGQADKGVPDKGPDGMLSVEQVWAAVNYERNLSNGSTEKSPDAGTSQSPTFAGKK
ncbi:MAG TPA: c-type cytochrome [Microthrixaceae bacterium]|nr:c-type cytochrome [Microthrixaceae bacterium]